MTYPGSIQTYGQPAPKSPSKATAAQVILGGIAAYGAMTGATMILSVASATSGSSLPEGQLYLTAAICGLVLGLIIGPIAKASTLSYSRGRGIGIAFGVGIVHYLLNEGVAIGVRAAAGQFDVNQLGDLLVDGLKYGGVLTLALMIGAAVVGPRATAFDTSGPTYIGVSSGPTMSPTAPPTSTVSAQPQSTVGKTPYRGSTSRTTGTSPYPGSPYGTSGSSSTPTMPNSPYGKPPGR